MIVHVVSQTTVSGRATAPEGSDVTLRSPSAVLCDSLTRRSRSTLLSRSVDQRSRLAVGREALHVIELDRSTPEGYERLKLLDACLTRRAAGSSRTLTPDLTATAVRHFLHWAQPLSQLDEVPRRPLLVSTTAARTNGRCLLWPLEDLRPM
jgi:hypothetical protein